MITKTVEKKTTLYIVLIFLSFSQIILECLGQNRITSALFYLSFVLLLYLWIVFADPSNRSYDNRVIVIAFLCVLNVFLEIYLDESSISLGAVKKIAFFVSCLMIYKISLDTLNVERIKKWCGIFALLCSAFFIVMYFTNRAAMYTRDHSWVSNYLTLNLGNPNKASLFICVILFMDIIHFFSEKRIVRKLLFGVCAAFFIYFMIETQSRGGMLTLVAFGIAMLLFLRRKKVHIPKPLLFLFAVFPLVFSILYLLTVNAVSLSGRFDFLVSEGKELSSRVDIWERAFSTIKDHWLIGGYSLLTDAGTGLYQMHNTHVDVLASFGIVVFMMYIHFLYRILRDLSSNKDLRFENFYYFLAFAFMIVLGSSEAAVVNGTNGLPILTAAFIAMSRQNAGDAITPDPTAEQNDPSSKATGFRARNRIANKYQ